MYEINYMQLHLLLGDIRRLTSGQVSRRPGRIPVRLDIRERSQHTTTLMLTYLFADDHTTRPDMLVRIYHDALQAEVVSHRCRLTDMRITGREAGSEGMLPCRWRMNRFLFKWVAYLRRQGYTFVHDNDV